MGDVGCILRRWNMAIKNVFHTVRDRMRKRREEKRKRAEEEWEQDRPFREAKARRSTVERDGVFYCQFCGKKSAKLGSGMVADDVAYCSESCGELLARKMFNRDATRGGSHIINMSSGALGSLGLGFIEHKHCKWCGETIDLDAPVCRMCKGAQERRTYDRNH